MAIQEFTAAQQAGVLLAIRALRSVTGADIRDMAPFERAAALLTVARIADAVQDYPHAILELGEHA